MGERGRGAVKHWLNRCADEYWEMIHGPLGWETTPLKVKQIRRHWREGGRELVMRAWSMPGKRPYAYWYCDIPPPIAAGR